MQRIEAIYRHIGDVIQEMREHYSWTQVELAEKLGWTRASISAIEAGRQRVMAHDFPRIAKALQIPVRALLPPDWTNKKGK